MPSSQDRPDRPNRGAGGNRDKPSGAGAPRTGGAPRAGAPRAANAPRTAGAGYQGGERSGAARGGSTPRTSGSGYQGSNPRTGGTGYAGGDRSAAPRSAGGGYLGNNPRDAAPRGGGSSWSNDRSAAPRSGAGGYQGNNPRDAAPRSGVSTRPSSGGSSWSNERSGAPRTGGSGYQGNNPRPAGGGYQGSNPRDAAPRSGVSTRPSGNGYEGTHHRDAYNPPGRGGAPRGGGMERGQWQEGQAERSERRPDTRSSGDSAGRDSFRSGSAAPGRSGSAAPGRGGSFAPGNRPNRSAGSSPYAGGSTRAQQQSRDDSAHALRVARGEEAPGSRSNDRPARSFDGPSDRPARSNDRPARSFDGPSDRPDRGAERPGRSFNNGPAARPDRPARPFDGTSARPARNAESGAGRSAERPGRSFNQSPDRPSRPAPSGTPGRPSSNHQDRPAPRTGGASRAEIEHREYDPRKEARRTAARVDLPEDVEARMLDPEVRQELRSLSKDTADLVARHLVMTGRLLDDEPEQALAHARAARAIAARVGAVREAAGLAAYTTGDWTDALSELRAARRITGQPGHLAVMADCERALGRPERALALGEDRDVARLTQEERVELVIVVSGARRDMGQCDAAVLILQDPAQRTTAKRPFAARLWYAYADALLDAGRQDEAREWFAKVVEVDQRGQTDAHERMLDLDGVQFEDLEDDGSDDEIHGWIEPDAATATAGLQAAFARLEIDQPIAAQPDEDDAEDDADDESPLTENAFGGDQPPWQAPVEQTDETATPQHRREADVPAVTFQEDVVADGSSATDAADDDEMRLFE